MAADDRGALVTYVAVVLRDDDGRILCVRQNYGAALWSLPGGGVEPGEGPVAAAVRETCEETGFEIVIDHIIGMYSTDHRDCVSLTFAGRIVAGHTWLPNDEIAERRWVSADELPSPLSPRMRQRLIDGFDGVRGLVRS